MDYTRLVQIMDENTDPGVEVFINTFFPKTVITDANEIEVGRYINGNKLARYRQMNAASNVTSYNAGKKIVYVPPYLAEKTPVSEELAHAVAAGISQNAPPSVHLAAKIARIREQHREMFNRTTVLQAVRIFENGKFQPFGPEKTPIDEPIDYGRVAANTIKKSYTATPMKQLTDPIGAILKEKAPTGNLYAIVGSKAMGRLIASQEFKDALTATYGTGAPTAPQQSNSPLFEFGRIYIPSKGYWVTIYNFSATWEDDKGESFEYINPEGIIASSFGSAKYQMYAGIFLKDSTSGKSGVYAGKMIMDALDNRDPDEDVLRTQSRPMLVPSNIDHTAFALNE